MIDREQILKQLTELQRDNDQEWAHIMADRILCNLLSELGYDDIVEEYTNISKWYA